MAYAGCQCAAISDQDCFSDEVCEVAATPDAGARDAGPIDASTVDAGRPLDAGGDGDAGPADAGMVDSGMPDAGGILDAGVVMDAGTADAGTPWLELQLHRSEWSPVTLGECETLVVLAHVPGQPTASANPNQLAYRWRDGAASALGTACIGPGPAVAAQYFGALELEVSAIGFVSARAPLHVLSSCQATLGFSDDTCVSLRVTTTLEAITPQTLTLTDSAGTALLQCAGRPYVIPAGTSSADLWQYTIDSTSHVTGPHLQPQGCNYEPPPSGGGGN